MSVAAEVVSAKALTLHFLQAGAGGGDEGETERSAAADHITHSRETTSGGRGAQQQISAVCTQRINFHCRQMVISESQSDSHIIKSPLMSHFMSRWSHVGPIKSLVTLPSGHQGWKLKP